MNIRFLNGNGIKLLAAVLMVIDHIGMFFFPGLIWLRCIGRLSLPLFAYMISEGCKYTKNKVRHALLLFCVALVCQVVYFIADGSLQMSILVTFLLSTLIIYAMQFLKRCLLFGEKVYKTVLAALLFLCSVFLTYAINSINSIGGISFSIEYGFWGCMLPVFASVFDFRGLPADRLAKLDNHFARMSCFAVGLFILCLTHYLFRNNVVQWFSLLALIPLALYNGKNGKLKLKYFFYIFYPAHLALFYIIAYFI